MTITIRDETQTKVQVPIKDQVGTQDVFYIVSDPGIFYTVVGGNDFCYPDNPPADIPVVCFSTHPYGAVSFGTIKWFARDTLVVPVDVSMTFTLPKGGER